MRASRGMSAILFGALLLSACACFVLRTAAARRPSRGGPAAARQAADNGTEWAGYGGGPDGIRYSSLNQIDRSNVGRLEVAWTYDSGDGPGGTQCQPLVAGGVLYAETPRHNVVALETATGKEIWRFDSGIVGRGPNRGVAYWTEGGERRILAAVLQYVSGSNLSAPGRHRHVSTAQGNKPSLYPQWLARCSEGVRV